MNRPCPRLLLIACCLLGWLPASAAPTHAQATQPPEDPEATQAPETTQVPSTSQAPATTAPPTAALTDPQADATQLAQRAGQLWESAQQDEQAADEVRAWLARRAAARHKGTAALVVAMDRSLNAPDESWSQPLIDLLGRIPEAEGNGNHADNGNGRAGLRELAIRVGRVLARIDAPATERKLADVLHNREQTDAARVASAYALSCLHNHDAAKALLKAATRDGSAAVSAAAYDGLALLSGRHDLPPRAEPWQAWWAQHRTLNRTQWQAALINNLSRHAHDVRQARAITLRELLAAKRRLYRQASRDQQSAELITMLQSPQAEVRELALELAVQGLVDGRPFDEPLRDAIRHRVGDPEPAVRRAALLLLRDLGDEAAADRVALRLRTGVESDPATLRAALSLLARQPRAQAVGPALPMLLTDPYRDEAAAFLAAAAQAGLLTPRQAAQARARALRPLDEGTATSPQIVSLLARVGTEEQWQRIADWIDAPRDEIKLAAAKAWAESDRSLKILADRLGDPVIQPIAIAAATRRGTDPFTLLALVETEPDRQSRREAWRRALVAMAGRVPADAVAQAAQRLATFETDTQAVRELMLSAAIAQAPPLPDDIPPDASRARRLAAQLRLHLLRAQLRRDQGDFNQAASDYATALSLPAMDRAEQINAHLGLIRTAFVTGRSKDAIAAAEQMLDRELFTDDHPLPTDALVTIFTTAAQRAIDADQPDTAGMILRRLVSLLEAQLTDDHRARIEALRQRLLNPPTNPTPDPDATVEPADGDADTATDATPTDDAPPS